MCSAGCPARYIRCVSDPRSAQSTDREAQSTDREPARSVALLTLGCARNEVDSEELAARLSAGGWQVTTDGSHADVVLVNTCGFVEKAKQDSIETLLAAAAFWGYGGLLTLLTFAGAGSYRHYMEIIAPLMALWTALFALWTDKGARRPFARPTLAIL